MGSCRAAQRRWWSDCIREDTFKERSLSWEPQRWTHLQPPLQHCFAEWRLALAEFWTNAQSLGHATNATLMVISMFGVPGALRALLGHWLKPPSRCRLWPLRQPSRCPGVLKVQEAWLLARSEAPSFKELRVNTWLRVSWGSRRGGTQPRADRTRRTNSREPVQRKM